MTKKADPPIEEPQQAVEPPKTYPSKSFLQYYFSHQELFDKGKELARIQAEITTLDSERKAVASEYKAKIETKQATLDVLTNHINSGCEWRYIQTTVHHNDPQPGLKSEYRNDTGELINCCAMTAEEMQIEIPFSIEEEERD